MKTGLLMVLASLAFLTLLVHGHDWDDKPLSMLRDGDQYLVGYTLFALLVLIGVVQTVPLIRLRRGIEAGISCLAVILLVIVAVTPSNDADHVLCSFVLLSLLFIYYAVVLYRGGSLWLIPHVAVPLVLSIAIPPLYSYGPWQKSLIIYFVVVANLHCYLTCLEVAQRPTVRPATKGRPLFRRRKVYRLELEEAWGRR